MSIFLQQTWYCSRSLKANGTHWGTRASVMNGKLPTSRAAHPASLLEAASLESKWMAKRFLTLKPCSSMTLPLAGPLGLFTREREPRSSDPGHQRSAHAYDVPVSLLNACACKHAACHLEVA